MCALRVEWANDPTLNAPVITLIGSYKPELIELYRKLPSSIYVKETRSWRMDLSKEDDERFDQYRALASLIIAARAVHPTPGAVQVAPEIKDDWAAVKKRLGVRDAVPEVAWKVPDKLGEFTLMPFQIADLEKAMRAGGRMIYAWEPGLGKTLAGIASVEILTKEYDARSVVVCPEYLRRLWKREFKRANPGRPVFLYGLETNAAAGWVDTDNGVLVVGYSSVEKLIGKVGKVYQFDILVIDECHYIKNPKADRTKAVKKLAACAPFVFPMSGTPIVQRPVELYPVLNMLAPEQFSNFFRYAREFCDAKRTHFGHDFSGASNLDKLHEILDGSLMARRRKKDVLKDLPPKTRYLIPIDITNRDEYDRAAQESCISWTDLLGQTRSTTIANTLHRINVLRQVAVAGKMAGAVDWLMDLIEPGQRPATVMTVHKDAANTLHSMLMVRGITSVIAHGGIPDYVSRIESFQNGHGDVLVGTIAAIGTGHTITRAPDVVFLEDTMVPGEMIQAEDRPCRIGQTNPCSAWYLAAADTYDENIIEFLHDKQQVLDQVLDGVVPGKNFQADDAQSFFKDCVETLARREDPLYKTSATGGGDGGQVSSGEGELSLREYLERNGSSVGDGLPPAHTPSGTGHHAAQEAVQ